MFMFLNSSFFDLPNAILAPILALISNISFGMSCLIFAHYSTKISSAWVNGIKALVSTFCFLILLLVGPILFNQPAISWEFHSSYIYLFLSGMIGLGFADIFLMEGLKQNGVARTLLFYALQPFLMAIFAYFLWSESIRPAQWPGIIVFVLTLLLFCYEKMKEEKREVKHILIVIFAVFIDCIGISLTKQSMVIDTGLSPVLACFIRGMGALFFLRCYFWIKGIYFFPKNENTKNSQVVASKKDYQYLFWASFFGTFLSLLCYISAIKLGQITVVTAVAVTSPLWATLFEFIFYKKIPSKIFILCFVLFILAFLWNIFASQ